MQVILGAAIRVVGQRFNSRIPDCETTKGKTYPDRISAILSLLLGFASTPFTVQRLAELLLSPDAIYTSTRKWLNAVTKAVAVSAPAPDPSSFSHDALNSPFQEGEPDAIAAARAQFEAHEGSNEMAVQIGRKNNNNNNNNSSSSNNNNPLSSSSSEASSIPSSSASSSSSGVVSMDAESTSEASSASSGGNQGGVVEATFIRSSLPNAVQPLPDADRS